MAARLARLRVPLGFGAAAVAIVLARPDFSSLSWGMLVAVAGEAVRVWAAGHLEKGREVTCSGPYRFSRHPLYVGSTVMAAGIAIASASLWVAAVAVVYLGATLTAAIRTEEAFLRRQFGDEVRELLPGPGGQRRSEVQLDPCVAQPRMARTGRSRRRGRAAGREGRVARVVASS